MANRSPPAIRFTCAASAACWARGSRASSRCCTASRTSAGWTSAVCPPTSLRPPMARTFRFVAAEGDGAGINMRAFRGIEGRSHSRALSCPEPDGDASIDRLMCHHCVVRRRRNTTVSRRGSDLSGVTDWRLEDEAAEKAALLARVLLGDDCERWLKRQRADRQPARARHEGGGTGSCHRSRSIASRSSRCLSAYGQMMRGGPDGGSKVQQTLLPE